MGYFFFDQQQGFFYMHYRTERIAHSMVCVTPVVEHWLERAIAQWVHREGSIRRFIASWANALTTELHLVPTTERKQIDKKQTRTYTSPIITIKHLFLKLHFMVCLLSCLWICMEFTFVLIPWNQFSVFTHWFIYKHEWMNECLTTRLHGNHIGYWMSDKDIDLLFLNSIIIKNSQGYKTV